jgi:phosphoribosyl-AMP cyclohydrolase
MELSELFQKSELVPVIVQDERTKEVLMLGYTNEEALRKTMETGTAWFWSRSRRKLWNKGETSGNFLHVSRIEADCDLDALLYFCRPDGPTCHTGSRSCFFNRVMGEE